MFEDWFEEHPSSVTVEVSNSFDFECFACGYVGQGFLTTWGTAPVFGPDDDNNPDPKPWFEAEEEARTSASASAWNALIDAVSIAPCPICERVNQGFLRVIRERRMGRAWRRGIFRGIGYGLVLGAFTHWYYGLLLGIACALYEAWYARRALQGVAELSERVTFGAPGSLKAEAGE